MALNRDLMSMVPVKAAANASMGVIDHVQDLPPHLQVIAIATSFKLLIERFDVSGPDAFTIVDNIMNHAEGRRAEFEAIRLYLANEV